MAKEYVLKKNLIILFLTVIIFSLTSCDNGKSNTDDANVNDTDQTVQDEEADLSDETTEEDVDEAIEDTPDVDNAPKITITCPEEIDEDSGKILCQIYSENQSTVLGPDDSCSGQIESETVYSFIPSEDFGPGTCIAMVRDTVSNETAQAEIKINEVNNAPVFSSSDFSGFTFYEGNPASREFYFSDEDQPDDNETDPGYVLCSVKDNTCGVEINVANEDYKCTVSGTMPEELTDGDCEFKLVLTDGYGEETVETVTAALTEKNETPTWTEEPASFEVTANSIYSGVNGKATDTDLPNQNDGEPGYLSCELDSDSCSFDIAVSSQRDSGGSVSCKLDFISGDMETCSVQYHVTDGIKSIYSNNVNIKVNPTVSIDCPETVNEEEELVCTITPNGGTPETASVSQSCYGSVVEEGGQWKYKQTFSEFESPKTCTAAVIVGEVTAEDTVEVLEVNNAPELTFDGACSTPDSTDATEGTDFYCYASFSDVDRPNTTATDPGFLTCEIKNNTCGAWLIFDENCNGTGKPDEESGGTTCSYTVEITDGYGETISDIVEITIAEYNAYPEFTSTPDTQYNLIAGEHLEFTYSASDSDLPNDTDGEPGYLKCGVINEEAQSTLTVTGEGTGTVTCSVEIDAYSENECASGCPVTFEVEDGFGRKRFHYAYIYVRKCIFFVKPDGTGTEGRDWNDAFGTIQEAVDKAWSGCEIWVAQGTYTNSLQDGSPVVTMKQGVKIIGGFEGTEVYDHQIEQYRYRPEDPIVHSVLDGENISYHVVVGSVRNAGIDGFIITNGQADGTTDDQKVGGGMYNVDTVNSFFEAYVSNCIFTGNYAETDGGAVYNEGFSDPYTEFYNCEFYSNSSGRFGGAVYSKDAANLRYRECEFYQNSSNNGGALVEYHSASMVEKSVFIENEASVAASSGGAGGAIRLTSVSAISIENSIFLKNNAETFGGAIDGGSNDIAVIDHTTFSNNTDAAGGSEAIYGLQGQVQNSIFWNNGVDTLGLSVTYSFGSGMPGTGNIESMPSGSDMFIDENNDLNLDPTSPAIDSANPSSSLEDDIEGTTRPLGDYSDMGAYEHKSVDADYYVDCEVASTGDGSSWASPFKTFHQAIGQLNSNGREGIIFVKGGNCSYSEVGMSQDSIVNISNGIKIYGGFAGTEKYLRERTDPSATPTILDGEQNNITVITVDGTPENVVIDGFVIRNGYAGGFSGALKTGSRIANCIFESNKAQYGGAMHITGSPYSSLEPSQIVNTSFVNNQATQNYAGGAIYFNHINSSNIKIYNCNFLYNSVAQLTDNGVAIYLYSTASYTDIRNSVFYLNRSKYNYAVDQISGIDEATLTDSITDTDPQFVNAPEYFAIAYGPGTSSRIDLYGIPTGVTTDYLVEINNDGILRNITSISGASVFFNPELGSNTEEGTSIQFWPAGTTSADIDMHLTGTSPCIDNGTYVSESFRDYSGKKRDTDAFDTGIYEY